MNVLILPGYRYPASLEEPLICGDLRNSFNLSRALARAGVSVTVLSRRAAGDAETQELGGVTVQRYRSELGPVFPTSFDVSVGRLARFRSLVRRADLVMLSTPLSFELLTRIPCPMFYVCSGLEDIRNYGTAFGERIQGLGIKLLRDPAKRGTWRRADRVNTTAEREAGTLVRLGVPESRISTIGPGVELDRYAPALGDEIETLRRELQPPDSTTRRIILSVSRFSPAKGLVETVRAFARLKAKRPDVFLVLVGVRHSHRSSYVRQVRRTIAELGLEHDVAIRENVPESRLPVYYSAAEITSVFSVGYDPLPTVMIESMSCGTPVVSTNFATRTQAITDGENGLMVPEGDEAAWVAAIDRLFKDRDLAERIRAAGLARVRAQFDMDGVAAQYLELYRSL